jgi:hypothetical protein
MFINMLQQLSDFRLPTPISRFRVPYFLEALEWPMTQPG